MKNLRLFVWIFIFAVLCNVACDKKDAPSDIPVVSQFVYDGMSMYYLWDEQMKSKKPTALDTDPKKYFGSLLYRLDRDKQWSFITDDVNQLLNDFSGEAARVIGFAPVVVNWVNRQRTYAVVRYVYPNSPAERAGLERGNVIWEINGAPITEQNSILLLESTGDVTFTVFDQKDRWLMDMSINVPTATRTVKVTPGSFVSNPVLFSDIYEIDGKKIGYLFYTAYRGNFNNYLFEVFSEFEEAGVTDLVLDLRYNPGGDVSAAIYLASMIAPKAEVEKRSIFTSMQYNDYVKGTSKFDGNYRLREYRPGFTDPFRANLDLSTVYIIATEFSASASELTTFCLRPFMNVVHIGGNTAGKNTASWTVHAYNDFEGRVQTVFSTSKYTAAEREELKNWAMQPIVAQYTDRGGKSFSATVGLIPDHRFDRLYELIPYDWTPIGDTEDYMFAKAISLITRQPYRAATRSISDRQLIDTELRSRSEEIRRRAVNLDNIPGL
ncbi:MAG: hypothetical protein LBI15_10115 [Dysgonamonadaceae bacterium]|jgi:C-terminal processing protease CtpA/Prc|nr:hypothetical protein [Dysgonamonadaceae bacterium]